MVIILSNDIVGALWFGQSKLAFSVGNLQAEFIAAQRSKHDTVVLGDSQ